MNRTLFLALSVLALASPAWCGDGTYTAGTPDEIRLIVNFEFNDVAPQNWEPLFREASSLLYDASEKQIKISQVQYFTNCKSARKRADIRIYDDDQDARSNGDGLGRPSSRIRLSKRHLTVTTSGSGDRGQVGLVHELGHYAFGLLEEYRDKNGAPSFCIATSGTTASLMDAGTGRKNKRTEFCISSNHRTGQTEQDKKRLNGSGTADIENVNSWRWIVSWVKERYQATLAEPTAPVADSSGFPGGPPLDPQKCTIRISVGLAGSAGSTPNQPFDKRLKQGAGTLVYLLDQNDFAGIVSGDASVSPLREMTIDNKLSSVLAVRSAQTQPTSDWSVVLRKSFDQLVTSPGGQDAIILVAESKRGPEEAPEDLLASLRRQGVAVHIIGWGKGDDTSLRRTATATAGGFLSAETARELDAHLLTTRAQIKGLEIIEAREGTLEKDASTSFTIPVDKATSAEGVDFVLTGQDLGLELIAPDGTRLSPRAEGVILQNDATGRLTRYRVWQPERGTWRAEISNKGSSPHDFAFQVHSLSGEITVAGFALSDVVNRSSPLAIRAVANTDDAIGGAEATAWIESPDGQRSPLELFDDGSEEHGDDRKNDGVYSNYFRDYRGNGSYTVEVTVSATRAMTVIPEEDEKFVSRPVPPFVRKDRFSVVVTGAPN